MNVNGKYNRDKDDNNYYTKQVINHSVINLEHLFENDIDYESQPMADWFDLSFQ